MKARESLVDARARLWLDDERPAPKGWIWAKDARDALSLIRLGRVAEASLDHDLGDNPWTGYWLVSQVEWDVMTGRLDYKVPLFAIHSANPVGRKKMQAAITSIEQMLTGVAE